MLTITLLGTAATMPLPDRALSAAFAATACCGTAARARRRQRAVRA
mgnify:CR=1 FL=1